MLKKPISFTNAQKGRPFFFVIIAPKIKYHVNRHGGPPGSIQQKSAKETRAKNRFQIDIQDHHKSQCKLEHSSAKFCRDILDLKEQTA